MTKPDKTYTTLDGEVLEMPALDDFSWRAEYTFRRIKEDISKKMHMRYVESFFRTRGDAIAR